MMGHLCRGCSIRLGRLGPAGVPSSALEWTAAGRGGGAAAPYEGRRSDDRVVAEERRSSHGAQGVICMLRGSIFDHPFNAPSMPACSRHQSPVRPEIGCRTKSSVRPDIGRRTSAFVIRGHRRETVRHRRTCTALRSDTCKCTHAKLGPRVPR